MAGKKPPVLGTALIAWKDAFRAIDAMPTVAGIAFFFVLVFSLAGFAIVGALSGVWLSVLSIVLSIVQAAVLAPLAIVVHRFVLLGESTNRYPLELRDSRYLRFAGFAILVKILWLLPLAIQILISSAELVNDVNFILRIAIMIVVVRRVILFPAIAIDAPGATWSNARRDTKGSSWRVAFIFVLTILPALAIDLPLYFLTVDLDPHASAAVWLLSNAIAAVVGVATLCAFAAAASHIYRDRADVLTRPSGSPGSAAPASPAASPSS